MSSAIRAGQAFIELTTRDTNLTKGLQNANAKIQAFAKSAAAAAQQSMYFLTAIAAPVGMAVKRFADFDDQMRLTKAVSRSTGAEFAALTEQAKKLGRETSFTAAQVAGGMASLGRMGFSQKEISAAIQPMMNLARATGTELADAAQIAANTMRAFGLSASQAGNVADILTATANGSAQTLTDLGEALTMAAAPAHTAGETIQDVNAALGVLANIGIKGSMAGTALKRAYSEVAKTKTQDFLANFGIKAADANGNLRKMADIMRDVAAAMATMGSAEKISFATQIFGERAAVPALGITADVGQIDSFLAMLRQRQGTAAATAKEMDSGIGGTMRILASAVEGSAMALGEALVPALKAAADTLMSFMAGVTKFIQNNGALITILAKAAMGTLKWSAIVFAVGKTFNFFNTKVLVAIKMLGALQNVGAVVVTAYQNMAAGISLAAEAMRASGGVLSARTFIQIADALGIAKTAANKFTIAILASSNAEVGAKTIAWLRGLPEMFSAAAIAARAYIARIATATAANITFSASCANIKAAISGAWAAISGAVVRMAKYVTTAGIAGAATAALGVLVKGLTVVVAGLRTALNYLAAHPIVAVLTVALAVLVATVGTIARRLSAETEQAKKAAKEAQAAYERATEATGRNQQIRVQGNTDIQALQGLATASQQAALTADEIETAVSLINSLRPFGSENWANIDTVTGRLTLATDAMKQFQEAARQQAIREAQAEITALDAQAAATKKQMATYGGWRDTFNLGWDTSVEYNEQYEKELDAIRAKRLAAYGRLKQAEGGNDKAIYGQDIKSASDKAAEAVRKRTVALEDFEEAQKHVAEEEKRLADAGKTALEKQIDAIETAKNKYQEMLKTMIAFEKEKAAGQQDSKKIAEWEAKLAKSETDAAKAKQKARDDESKKAQNAIRRQQKAFDEERRRTAAQEQDQTRQKQINNLAKTDPERALTILQQMVGQYETAAKNAANEFNRATKDAMTPDADGVSRITDAEQARIDAAKADYSENQSRMESYRNQLYSLAEQIKGTTQSKTVAGFDARTVTGLFGRTDTLGERQARSAENIEHLVKQILGKFNGSGLVIS